MPQGNYIALQQLKPIEYKIGDTALQFTDWLIKKGEAEKAAKAKLLADQNASLEKIIATVDPKLVNTIPMYQDKLNSLFNDVMASKNEAQKYFNNTAIPYNERLQMVQAAKNAENDYLKAATFFSNPDNIKGFDEFSQKTRDGKIFKGDENYGLYMSINSGNSKIEKGDDGRFLVSFYDNAEKGINEANVKKIPLDEAWQRIRTGGEYTTVPDTETMLKGLTTTYTTTLNRSGNRTVESEEFATKKVSDAITAYFGFDPSKPIEEQFVSPNSLSPQVRHYFYEKTGNYSLPQTPEDVKKAIQVATTYAKGYTDESKKDITEKSALEIANQQQELANKRLSAIKLKQDIANPGGRGSRSGGSGGSGENGLLGDGTLSVGNVVLNVDAGKNKNSYQTKGLNYFATGSTDSGKATKIGVTTYWNPNAKGPGKGGFSVAMSMPSTDGKEIVITGVSTDRAKSILASYKVKNPQNLLSTMQTVAEQNGLSGYKPKPIGSKIKKYDVNFEPTYKSDE